VTAVEVPAVLEGERIDKALALVTGRSRTEIASLIASGGVRVGGLPVTSRHSRVHSGALLEFELAERAEEESNPVVPEEVAFSVIYEDPELIVVDKPAGLVVHPGAGQRTGTLAAGLLARFPDLVVAGEAGAGDSTRPGIVHRLDKDTSGLLIVARTPESWRSLTDALALHEITREYFALAIGRLEAGEGSIDAPIGRSRRDRTKMAVAVGGRPALTHYRVASRYRVPLDAALLELKLATGRTHQIRVHLAAIGHPIAGDSRYRGGLSSSVRAETGIRRPFLHATRLRFVHPLTRKEMVVESPLPPELKDVLTHFS